MIPQRRSVARTPVAIAALALVACVGGILVLTNSPSSAALKHSGDAVWVVHSDQPERLVVASPTRIPLELVPSLSSSAAAENSDAARTAGTIVFFTALAGIILLALLWLWPRRRVHEPKSAH